MIKAIFAVDMNGGMGKNGTLPWPKDQEDLNWFKKHTSGHVVVMGSRTWLDPMMPKPLPNRFNVVMSDQDISLFRGSNYIIPTHNIESSLALLQKNHTDKDIWVIGGARTLIATKNLIQQIVLTEFSTDYDCDIRIDVSSYLERFEKTSEIRSDNKTFRIYHAKLS